MAVKQNIIFHFIFQIDSRFKIFTDKDCIKMHFLRETKSKNFDFSVSMGSFDMVSDSYFHLISLIKKIL